MWIYREKDSIKKHFRTSQTLFLFFLDHPVYFFLIKDKESVDVEEREREEGEVKVNNLVFFNYLIFLNFTSLILYSLNYPKYLVSGYFTD